MGILADEFPNATGIAFNYGFSSDIEPENAMGLYIEASDGSTLTYLREFELVSQIGNRLEINFLDDFYFSEPPIDSPEEGLITFTNQMFEGGSMIIFEFPNDGNRVFWLYNPCNNYELLLVP